MMHFKDRKAAVTGGGTGLGREIALGLARGGADLVLTYSRSADEAEATAAEARALGVDARAVKADAATADGAQALARACAPWGRLDVLVCNAGITKHAPNHGDLDALSAEDFQRVYAVNVIGPFLAVQACAGLLRASRAATGLAAAVLNTSSIAGVTGIGSSVAYAASKGALNTMTLSLARALGPDIRVNAICPGFIGTRWFKDSMDPETYARTIERVERSTPLQAASDAEDIAGSALFLVSDLSRHVTGETLMVDAGAHLNLTPLKAR